jgi:hypothetical protein
MPEFIASHIPDGLDYFVAGYLECAEFTFSDTDPETGEHLESVPDDCKGWSDEAKERATADCTRFMQENAAMLDDYASTYNGGYDYSSIACAGHDFWYTRNRHGVSFRDRGDNLCFDALQEAAMRYGEVDAYMGDDRFLYLS